MMKFLSSFMESPQYYFLALMFLLLIIVKSFFKQGKNSPPSPLALPILGHLHLMKKPFHQTLATLSSQYGPIFSLQLGCKSFVIVSSPSAIEECFTKNDIVFANRPPSMVADQLTYNYSAFVLSPYGHFWRVLRRLAVVELFSSHSLNKSAAIRGEEICTLVRHLFGVSKGGATKVDLNHLASVLAFNVVMRVISEKPCVEEKDIGTEVGNRIIKDMRGLVVINGSLGECDFFPFLRWIGYKGIEKSLISLFIKRDKLAQCIIDEFQRNKGVHSSESIFGSIISNLEKRALIETLLTLQQSEPKFYTNDVIKSTLLIMLAAGSETSSITIEWAMSLLLANPDTFRKLREEIDNVVGQERLLNDSDLPTLPYLRCVVNETLRLYPPAPMLLPHYSTEDCVLGGYKIPKDTILFANAWAVHRDPSVWEEPERFKPERFESIEVGKEGFKFVPFGAGRRACPGAAMGMRNISLAIGALVQCFEWEMAQGDDVDADYNSRVTLRKAKPLEALCSPRQHLIHLLCQI